MSFRLLRVLVLLLFTQLASGQKISYNKYTHFINFDEKSGLSHQEVHDIIQDKKGFIWFATENGLSRFDGYSFVNFVSDPNNTNSLPGNTVTSLALDKSENLWVGTTEGLAKIDLNSGIIIEYKALLGDPNSIRNNHVRKLLYSSSTDIIWIETLDGTLTSLCLTSNQWNHYSHLTISQPYYRYHSLFEDSEGNIWLGGRNTPVIKFNRKDGSFQVFESKGEENNSKRDNDVASIFQSSRGEWFVTGLDGIYSFCPDKEMFKKIYATSTYSITEDSSGNVWFGTGNGLIKYTSDRKEFEVFQNNQNNSSSLINNHINKVFIDKAGNIWLGTRKGISLMSKKSSQIRHFYNIPEDKSTLSSNDVTAFAEDKNGTLYIGTSNNGLNIFKPNSNSFERIESSHPEKCSLSSDRISTLLFDSRGDLWVGLWSGIGFNRYNPQSGCFSRYAIDYDTRKSDWYNAFLEDSKGNFILGVWGSNGATYFDRTKGKILPKHFNLADKPYYYTINKIFTDGFGHFFFFTSHKGVIYNFNSKTQIYSGSAHNGDSDIYNTYNQTLNYNLPFSILTANCFSTNGVGFSLIGTDKGIIGFDKDEGYYAFIQGVSPLSMVIIDDRIFVLENDKVSVYDYNANLLYQQILEGDQFKEIIATDEGRIFIMGDQKIVSTHFNDLNSSLQWKSVELFQSNRLDAASIQCGKLWLATQKGLYALPLKSITDKTNGISDLQIIIQSPVSAIAKIDSTNLIAYSATGVYKVNCIEGTFSSVSFSKTPEGFNSLVKTACSVSSDTVWIGNEGGHYKMVISTGEFIETNLPGRNRASSRLVSTLMEDSEGNIWIGTTDKGLNRVDANTGLIDHFYSNTTEPSLPSNRVNATIQTADGKIWVATDKGLCYIVSNRVFRVNDRQAELDMRSLVEDDQGLLWAGTSQGLVSVDPATTEISFYNESHGLPSASFSKASMKLSSGKLAFGSSNGFFIFDPKTISKQFDFSQTVSFSQLTVFDVVQKNLFKQNDTLKFNYWENFFRISFSAFEFGKNPSTFYQYRLVGVDPSWVTTQSRSATYTNLSPGKYKFEVRASSSNGLVADKISSLILWIKPAFWQTLWFRLIIVLLVLLGLSIYLYTYIRQLKAARLNVELEQRLLVSQMNPHFIFNSLSAIQSFVYNNQAEDAGNYLSSFSRLVRLILENSRSSSISLEREIQTLELYFTLQRLRFPDKFNYKINVDSSIIASDIHVPPMLAQPFIENSIEHGIMHKKGMGNIVVSIELISDLLCISVEDDGVGIEKSKEINFTNRISHNSLATSITRERIRNISTRNDKRIGVKIIDLFEHGREGTRVEIVFPFFSSDPKSLKK